MKHDVKIGNIYRFPSGNEVKVISINTIKTRCTIEYTYMEDPRRASSSKSFYLHNIAKLKLIKPTFKLDDKFKGL